ncbi:MAG: GspH/FimT family pseudopilin, partial [Pseudomonadota bacterium]
ILISLVGPNYSPMMARMTVTAETKRMIGILKQARSEARARGATVTVRRDAGSDWSSEVLVYESTVVAGNADYTPAGAAATVGDDLIGEHAATQRTVTINDDATANGQFISFSLQGWLSTSETREILIAVCSPALPDAQGMYIEVNRVGKIRERSIDGDARGCL